MELQHIVKDVILQNGSEKVQNWLYGDKNSFCNNVGSQISDTAGDGQRYEQNAEIKSFCDAAS
jgi:hypothetical protein